MSDATEREDATPGAGAETTGSLADLADAEVWRYLRLGTIGLLALFALLSTVELYVNASAAIARWVSPDYEPAFQAAFNLVVLLLALSGLAVVARR